MVNLGMVVFANNSGLGNQTRRLAYMLKPDRILAIDSSSFSKNKDQHFEWYDGFSGYKVDGFPSNREVAKFLKGLTHVFLCENPLNFHLIKLANVSGIKTYIQSNYEFCDNLANSSLPVPHKFVMPSYWMVDEMRERFGDDKVVYLPPPIDPREFQGAREDNFRRTSDRVRFLHVVGTLAAHDRNGTKDLLEAVKLTEADFELVIRSQHDLPDDLMTDDKRFKYVTENVKNPQDIYRDFDTLILPRRYGGLCLPMWEALMSGVSAIMTDISPNNSYLPKDWLVSAKKGSQFMARTMIDVYNTNIKKLAEKIDEFAEPDSSRSIEAFDIAYNNVSPALLRETYENLWSL